MTSLKMDSLSISTPQGMASNDSKMSFINLSGPPETMNIDPNGDILFEVGGRSDGKLRLLVSSKILSLASPVFAAMFRHGFQEGKNLSSGFLDPIPLPDDDAEAITLLFKALHFRSRDIPWSPDLVTLTRLAVVCDKYDCVAAIAPWSTVWLMNRGGLMGGGVHDIVMILYISYSLDVPTAFSEASLVLMKEHLPPFQLNPPLPGSEATADLIPEHLADEIQRAREELYLKLDEAISNGVASLIEMSSLWCVRTRIGSYFATLSSKNLWPPAVLRKTSVQKALKKARAIVEPERGSMPCANSRCVCRSSVQPLKQPLGEALAATVKSTRGLCLDCVKTGGESRRDGTCKVSHGDEKIPIEGLDGVN